jgi:hypothetical protein
MAAKDGIVVRVQVPAMSGYSTKKFDRTMTVAQAIAQINNSIPSSLRSDRYRLYCNSLRMLDEDRTLFSYGVKDNVREAKQNNFFFLATHSPSPPHIHTLAHTVTQCLNTEFLISILALHPILTFLSFLCILGHN